MTPFLLCLLARPEHEQLEAFVAVSRARAALELREKGQACRGKWCRWVMSALGDNSAATRQPSATAGASAPGCALSDQHSSMGRLALVETPLVSIAEEMREGFPSTHRDETNGRVNDTDDSLDGIQSRVRALQGVLENRLQAVGRPPLPPAGTLPSLLRNAKSDPLLGRAVARYSRTADGVNARLGGRGVTLALEEALGCTGTGAFHRGRRVPPESCPHHAHSPAQEDLSSLQRCAGESPRDDSNSTALTSRGQVCEGSWDGSKRADWAWARPGELEDCRRTHRDRLEGLLSACARAMPLTPRGAGW